MSDQTPAERRMWETLARNLDSAEAQRLLVRQKLADSDPDALNWLDLAKKDSPPPGSSGSKSTVSGSRGGQKWTFADRALKD